MNIPFLNLKAQYDTMRPEIASAIQDVLESTAFAGGPFVAAFEKEFARFCDSAHAVGVGNGTDALWLPLVALGIKPGDEVITVPNSFIATAEAISLSGATPVFVDVDERTFTMDPTRLEAAITPRTKAIIPVHLFGQPADMDAIMEIAGRHGIPVIEDAAQAHGALYKGRPVGSFGIAGCFSFYPGKNLGAYGEAGGITTNDEQLASTMRVFRDHGQPRKYVHSVIGWNARMDGIQGAILSVKLKRLSHWNEARRHHARHYTSLLQDVEGILTPVEADYSRHVYHIYAVRVEQRDEVMKRMGSRGVNCAIHYPVPIHLQEAYAALGLGPGSFPVAERCAGEFLSLPMYAELTAEQVDYAARQLVEVVSELSREGALVG